MFVPFLGLYVRCGQKLKQLKLIFCSCLSKYGPSKCKTCSIRESEVTRHFGIKILRLLSTAILRYLFSVHLTGSTYSCLSQILPSSNKPNSLFNGQLHVMQCELLPHFVHFVEWASIKDMLHRQYDKTWYAQ